MECENHWHEIENITRVKGLVICRRGTVRLDPEKGHDLRKKDKRGNFHIARYS